jgi:hypothetical protein
MTDNLSCPECGASVESKDELVAEHEVSEIEFEDDGSLNLYGNRDLYLCEECKKPMGVGQ